MLDIIVEVVRVHQKAQNVIVIEIDNDITVEVLVEVAIYIPSAGNPADALSRMTLPASQAAPGRCAAVFSGARV